ncbi:type II toxin-antitoxin system RelB/DinJ family antitoxin [bacterium]|nr:type II toxin-antitoxin system RelB/DinJ family antitoxin [bacterium]
MKQFDTRIQTRLDSNLKQQAEKVFDALGMDLATAIRLFLKQAVIQNGLPFGMMGLDGLKETCSNQVTRELLVSDGHAYEVLRTQQTCKLASPETQAQLLQTESGSPSLAKGV